MDDRVIIGSNGLIALSNLLQALLMRGCKLRDRTELVAVVLRISAVDDIRIIERFSKRYRELVGSEFWARAVQLYTTTERLSWKASYRGRIVGASPGEDFDQLAAVVKQLAHVPGSNALSLSFFRPLDLRIVRANPAGIPCPLAIDFKFRENRLHLNAFFRTHDALRLGLPDIYFLRHLQREVLVRALRDPASHLTAKASMGEMTIFHSRVFVRNEHRELAVKLVERIEEESGSGLRSARIKHSPKPS